MAILKHEALCSQCTSLPLSVAHAVKHADMQAVFKTKDLGTHGSQTLYRCTVCSTHWLHQTDKWRSCLGFKLWPGNPERFHSYASYQLVPLPRLWGPDITNPIAEKVSH